jgi:acetyl-CoA carboxylase beta subunit
MLLGDPEEERALNDLVKDFMTFIAEPKNTMQEIIHKCLRCDTISYEIQPQLYHCPDCGFEWEVI